MQLWLHVIPLVITLFGGPACAAPTMTSDRLAYPLERLKPHELAKWIMSGGRWLNGLPGHPRYNGSHVHAGLDFRADLGETVFAITDGVVDPTSDMAHGGYGPGWTCGGVVIVRSLFADVVPYLVVYGHTQNHVVKGGERVVAGQALAEIGPWLEKEGGPHLHLTVRMGELPRYGWGTPTLPGQPLRPGAECAGTPEDVLALGYRDPMALLSGDLPGEEILGVDSTGTRHPGFASAVQQLQRRLRQGEMPRAGSVSFSPTVGAENLLRRCGSGRVQHCAVSPLPRILMLRDGQEVAYLVEAPVVTPYLQAGGWEKLGYPVSDRYDWGPEEAQSFERALIVCDNATGASRVILR